MEQQSIAPLISLDEIIQSYMLQHDIPESKFDKVQNFAIRGFRLFYRDSTGVPKSVILPVLANNTSVLPTDCMNKIAIGVRNQRGEMASLTYDSLLLLSDSENPNRKQDTVVDTLVTDEQLYFSYIDGLSYGEGYWGYGQYGLGSTGVIGRYNIDWSSRVIVYDYQFNKTEVEFVYMALPTCMDGDYAIHPFFQEPLHNFIDWQYRSGDKKSSRGDKIDAKTAYDASYRNARKAMQPFDPSDVYNGYRQGVRLSPKA